jgi:transcription antitermination protein NusB
MNRRRAARFGAIQALYQLELTGARPEQVILEFESHRLADLLEPLELDDRPPKVDREWFRRLTLGAWRMAPELDPMIEPLLAAGWTLDRAGFLLRALLRAGAYELAAQPDVPVKAVINEYVELAHAFLAEDEAGFVNALLDRLAGQLRPAGDAADGAPS